MMMLDEPKFEYTITIWSRKTILGIAAQIAGIPRITFLLSLHKFGVAAIDLEEDKMLQGLKNVQANRL